MVTRASAEEPFICPNHQCMVRGRSQHSRADNFILHAAQCVINSPSAIGLSGEDSMSQSNGSASAALLGGSASAASTVFERQVRAREENAGEEAEGGAGGSSSSLTFRSLLMRFGSSSGGGGASPSSSSSSHGGSVSGVGLTAVSGGVGSSTHRFTLINYLLTSRRTH